MAEPEVLVDEEAEEPTERGAVVGRSREQPPLDRIVGEGVGERITQRLEVGGGGVDDDRRAPHRRDSSQTSPTRLYARDVRIAFATDERTSVTDHVERWLADAGHDVVVVAARGGPWPDAGAAVGRAVASGDADRGVVCCWTGTGVSIAANKVDGVRAALCTDAATADGARRWNDANVLAFGLRLTSEATAIEMLEAFLAAEPDPAELSEIEKLR